MNYNITQLQKSINKIMKITDISNIGNSEDNPVYYEYRVLEHDGEWKSFYMKQYPNVKPLMGVVVQAMATEYVTEWQNKNSGQLPEFPLTFSIREDGNDREYLYQVKPHIEYSARLISKNNLH